MAFMKTRNILGLIAVALFAAILVVSVGSSSSIYTDFSTAQQSDNEVHIVGEWVQRTKAQENIAAATFTFLLKDSTGKTETVYYNNPKPSNFEQTQKIVVIGKYYEGRFVANKILMKCPSKYEENIMDLPPEKKKYDNV